MTGKRKRNTLNPLRVVITHLLLPTKSRLLVIIWSGTISKFWQEDGRTDGHPLQDNIDNRDNKITAVKNFTFFNLHSFSSVCNFFMRLQTYFRLPAFLHSNVSRRSRALMVKISQVRKLIPKSPRGVYFESPPIVIAFTQGRNRGRCGDYNLHSSSVAFLTCLKCIFCWETGEMSVDSQSHLI